MKTNGADFKAWLSSDWGDDAWWDDYLIEINGVEVDDYDESKIADTDKIKIVSGVVLLDRNAEKQISAQSHFRKWMSARTHETIVVQVEKAHAQEFRELIADLKYASLRKV